MTWREGVEYWRAWARRDDGDVIRDAARLAAFYQLLSRHCRELDDEMPKEAEAIIRGTAP